MIELTEPLQTAVEKRQDEPIRLVNPRTNEEYVLLRAEDYEMMKLGRLTPPNVKLRELAAKYPPPPEYFDGDEEIPFEPVKE